MKVSRMENTIKKLSVCVLIILTVLFSSYSSAKAIDRMYGGYTVAAELDPTQYEIKTVNSIASDFLENTDSAKKTYYKSALALIGSVNEVQDGKLILINPYSQLRYEIRCSSIKEQIKNIRREDSVVALGKVTKADGKSLVLTATKVDIVDEELKDKESGLIDGAGTIYDPAVYYRAELPGIAYIALRDWQILDSPVLDNYQIRNGVEGATRFYLGDEEVLNVFSLDWIKLERAVQNNSNGLLDWKDTMQERARDFLADEFKMGIVHPENIGKINTPFFEFDYYVGSRSRDDSITGEAFFKKIDDKFIVVHYMHGDDTKHSQEAAFFLGGIEKSDGT